MPAMAVESADCSEEPILSYLRQSLGNQSIMSCQDAKPYCCSAGLVGFFVCVLRSLAEQTAEDAALVEGNSITKMPEWSIDGGMGFTTRMFCSDTWQFWAA